LDTSINDPKVQATRGEILAAIDAELEASASLHWKQFLTTGIVDRTKLEIVRRLCICFWLPMIGEWLGVSMIGYYSPIILSQVASADLVSVLSGVLTTFAFLGTVPLYFTLESFGQRTIMMGTAFVATLLFIAFTVLVVIGGEVDWSGIALCNHVCAGVWVAGVQVALYE
jgi:hypothetical protein